MTPSPSSHGYFYHLLPLDPTPATNPGSPHPTTRYKFTIVCKEGSKAPYEQWKEIWEEELKKSEHLKQKYMGLLSSHDVSTQFTCYFE